jgi:hypothetical protein
VLILLDVLMAWIEKINTRSSSLRIIELVILFLNWLLSIDII